MHNMLDQQPAPSPAAHQLTLVAPMPRRPIALVARRHHNHYASAKSRSHRISRGGSIDDTSQLLVSPSALDKALPWTQSRYQSATHSGSHPYSRKSTNASSHSSSTSSPTSTSPYLQGGPLGASASTTSPAKDRHSRRRKSLRSAIECLEEAAAASASAAHSTAEPHSSGSGERDAMCASEDSERTYGSPRATSTARPSHDVERTPTKDRERQCIDPASTPTATAEPSQRSAEVKGSLTLLPRSPNTQRLTAVHAQLSASIASCFSTSGSSSLSPSRSRSPSTSPSPCPSPSYRARSISPGRDGCLPNPGLLSAWGLYEEDGFSVVSTSRRPSAEGESKVDDGADEGGKDSFASPAGSMHLFEQRKMRLPLPMPTSPIPRRLTRNPFERFLCVDLDLSIAAGRGRGESGGGVDGEVAGRRGVGRRSLDADRNVFLSLTCDHVARRNFTSPGRLAKSRTALGLFQPFDGHGDDDVLMQDGGRASPSPEAPRRCFDAPSTVMDED